MDTFKIEAEEHLNTISSGLLELETHPPEEKKIQILENIYRQAHSLKGSARAVDMNAVESICQFLESIFKTFKYGHIPSSPDVFDILQSAIDTIHLIVSGQHDIEITPILQQLGKINEGTTQFSSIPTTPIPAAPALPKTPSSAPPASIETEPAPRRFTRQGYLTPTTPTPTSTSTSTTSPGNGQPPPRNLTPEDSDRPSTIRVAIDKLDNLLLQAEEMIFMKLSLNRRVTELKSMIPVLQELKKKQSDIVPILKTMQKKASPSDAADWNKVMECLDIHYSRVKELQLTTNRLIKMLQADHRIFGSMINTHMESMRTTLMLPFSSITESFPRMVRDLARQHGKEIDLFIKGNDIEIDKRILEEIKSPLIHLLRNAVDHGIENPEQRIRSKKPPKGSIQVIISRKENNRVEIAISDDGQGLDLEKIRSKALQSNQYSEDELNRMSDKEIESLIFDSEFSTSPIISDLSGRGLGLAIVREKVGKLGGHIDLVSNKGKGTTFRILLRTTLATFRGILIQSAGQRFIIPTINVKQVLKIKRTDIKTVENRETIKIGNTVFSLVHFRDILQLPGIALSTKSADFVQVVVLEVGDRRIAFCVDNVLDEEEVLVKDLGKQLTRIKNIAGASVLGSGDVVLIINVVDIIKSAVLYAGTHQTASTPGQPAEAEAPKKSILVVEDSITSRMLLKNILESAGYRIRVAVDGMDGWLAVKNEPFDAVILDIEMPGMNGFQLTEKIREDKKLSRMPVVLVTALESREDRERGIDVGADAYIVKSSFDQSNLLEVVQKLV